MINFKNISKNKIIYKPVIIDGNTCPICDTELNESFVDISLYADKKVLDVRSKYCNKCLLDYVDENTFRKNENLMNNGKSVIYKPPSSLLIEFKEDFKNFIYEEDSGMKYVDFFKNSEEYYKLYSVDLIVNNKKRSYVLNNFNDSIDTGKKSFGNNEISIYNNNLGGVMEFAIIDNKSNFFYKNKKYEFLKIVNLQEKTEKLYKINKGITKKVSGVSYHQLFQVLVESEAYGSEIFVITDKYDKKEAANRYNKYKEISYFNHPLAQCIIITICCIKNTFVCGGIDYEIINFFEFYNDQKYLIDAFEFVRSIRTKNEELCKNYRPSRSITENIYYRNEYNEYSYLNEQSYYYKKGYSADENGPDELERQNILINIIEKGEKSKSEVLSFIRCLMNSRRKNASAYIKWQSDYNFIRNKRFN